MSLQSGYRKSKPDLEV